ncbi:MAG: Ig-like domain-containing protein, partial [bacterium]
MARNDSARTAENTSVRINVMANDRDPDGRLVARSIRIVKRPKHGRVRNHRNGTVTYTPASGFTGQDWFRYRVRDDDHAISRAARVRMIVERGNHPPLADAGSDTNTTTALPVTLNGSGSSDPDGDALTFLWRFLSVPPPSTVTDASLANGNTAAPRFTPDVDGPYELALEASDGARSDVDSVIVMARTANVPPNANAGPDASAVAGQLVNLDGRGSTDPDNGPAPPGFHWSFAGVPPGSLLSDIDIAGANTALASFTPDFAGDYRISLDVDDGADTGRDEVLI